MAWRRQLKREFGLSGQRNQKKQCLDELARPGAGRTLRFEPLEDRRLLAADFGDAPAPYPTLLLDNGARHEAVGPRLGAARGTEADGQPSATAEADTGDDGVMFGAVRAGQLDATVIVDVQDAPDGAILDAWIDFNGNGSWADPGERIANGVELATGLHSLEFDVPATVVAGETFARFRLSSDGIGSPTGVASDGEVEDASLLLSGPTLTDGVFTSPNVLLADTDWPTGLATGDIDGDGDIDVATVFLGPPLFGSESMALSINDGSGHFSYLSIPTAGQGNESVAMVDVDGDGDLDLLYSAFGNTRVSWVENQGNLEFVHRDVSSAIFGASDATLADIDGDGDNDVAASGADSLYWIENHGDDTFSVHAIPSTLGRTEGVSVADMDADGDLDLIASSRNSRLSWFEQTAAGQFTEHTISDDTHHRFHADPIDFDGDGDLDIVASASSVHQITWYENSNSGVFIPHVVADGLVEHPGPLAVADLEGDGDMDIIAGTSLDRGVWWIVNDGNWGFTAQQLAEVDETVSSVAVADLDGDGSLDVMWTQAGLGTPILWLENPPTANATASVPLTTEGAGQNVEFSVVLESPVGRPLSIPFELGGTATLGEDYELTGFSSLDGSSGVLVVPAGSSRGTITVTPIDDVDFEPNELVTFRVMEGLGFVPGPESKAFFQIGNDDYGGDLGDAPTPYQTLLRNGGAAHTATGPILGSSRTPEVDATPSEAADTDPGDDGVTIGSLRVGQLDAGVMVLVSNASDGAIVDGWIDFNGDGSWNGAEEHIITRVAVDAGESVFRFDVPAWAASGTTYARFRVSTSGGYGSGGYAADGEVEDYAVEIHPPAVTNGVLTPWRHISTTDARHTSLATADLDGDGDLDLVGSSNNNSSLRWYANDGNQNYAQHVIWSGVSRADSIHLADVNSDGSTDVLIASRFDGTLAWHVNNGLGEFSRRVVTSDFPGVVTVRAADLDGDGDTDIVASSATSDQVRWFENTGENGFVEQLAATGLPDPTSLELGDVDQDGDVDVVYGSTYHDQISWLENMGELGFAKRDIDTSALDPTSLYLVDLDHDGDLDVVSTHAGEDKIAWYESTAGGGFVRHPIPADAFRNANIAIGDLDGDGDYDIAALPYYDNEISWLENTGEGEFELRSFAAQTPGYWAAALADVDSDGDLDLLAVGNPDSNIVWSENTVEASIIANHDSVYESGDGVLEFEVRLDLPARVDTAVSFRARGDAVLGEDYDLLGAELVGAGEGTVVIAAGATSAVLTIAPRDDSEFEVREAVSLSLVQGPGYQLSENAIGHSYILSEDFGADLGDAPAPYPSSALDSSAAHLPAGPNAPRLGYGVNYELDVTPTPLADSDDLDDGVRFGVLRVGQALAEVTVSVQGSAGVLDAWIDFDGDGSWSGPGENIFSGLPVATGENTLYFRVPSHALPGVTYARFRVSSEGTPAPIGVAADGEVEDYPVSITPPVRGSGFFVDSALLDALDSNSGVSITADIDGDGDLDFVQHSKYRFEGHSPRIDHFIWYENDGEGAYVERLIGKPFALNANVRSLTAADMDDDGDLDVLVEDSTRSTIYWFENREGQQFTRREIIPDLAEPTTYFAVTPVDLDGDGDMDIVAALESERQLAWLENDGSQSYRIHLLTGARSLPYISIPTDLDGDGDLDIVTQSPHENSIAWYENDGHQGFRERLLPTLLPMVSEIVAADIDADGDIDLAVASSSSDAINWLENRGPSGFANRTIATTASNVAGISGVDFDGDGDIDIVSHQSDGTINWHENQGADAFPEHLILASGRTLDGVSPEDFDGDGDIDVVIDPAYRAAPTVYSQTYQATVTSNSSSHAEANEDSVSFTVELNVPATVPLAINLSFDGTASDGQDYTVAGPSWDPAGETLLIPAGQASATLTFSVIDDRHVESLERLRISVREDNAYDIIGVGANEFDFLSDDTLADFGDAPAPYRTLFAEGGAHHSPADDPVNSLRLGALLGSEPDGAPSTNAGADSSDDGVVFGELRPGMQDASVTVTVGGAAGILDAWIDFNADGSWDGVDERVFSSVSVGEGVSELQFDVPSYVGTGPIYARFRLSSVGSLTPGGLAIDGEVEDYLVEVASPVETDGVFVPHTLFAASIVDPYSFEAGDIDGDGDIDIVVGLHGPSRIVWLENDGNQGFTERLVAFGASRVLALGDLDTDGDLDLVAADVTLDRVQWFQNDGQGVFGAHLVVDGWGMSAAAIADMNVDGVLDIVLLSESDEQLAWFRRESDGAFSERHIAGDLGNAGRLTVADLDRDGDIDVVTAGNAESSSPLRWHENQGIGLFATHVVDASLRSSVAARVIDFDLDGDHDIILSNRDHAIAWYENDGEQWFELRPEVVASSVRDAELGDFDGDGSIDVVSVGGFTYGRAYLFKRRGPDELTQAWLSPNFGPHDASLTTDLDGDGDLDLVALSSNSDQLTWLENVVTASFEAGALPLLVSEGEVLPIAVSIDHERTVATKITLGVEGAATEGDDYRFVGATRGEFGEWTVTIPAGALSASFSLVAVDDLLIEDDEELLVSIGDGHDYQVGMSNQWEIVLASDDSLADFGDAPSPYATLLALGGAHHAPTRDGESGPRLGESLTLESDGAPSHTSDSDEDDGVVLDEYLIGQNNALLSVNVQGAGGLLDAWIDFNRDGSWGGPGEQIFASLPVEEGESELVFSVPTWAASGTTVARFRVSTSGGLGYAGGAADGEVEDYSVTINPAPRATGEFADSQQILGGPVSSGYARELVVGDIDADGDQDLVAWSQADGLLVLENLGGSVYETRSLGFNETLTELQIVDLDRNGFSELLVLRNGKLIWLSLQGEADIEPIDLSPEAYPAISAFAVADLNGDTRPDIIRTSNNGRILWLENLGQGEFASHLIENHAGSFNIEPHDVDAADFDRDGDIDIAIAGRDFFGETLVYVNNGAGLFTERRIAHDPARLVVFDDLDGDGHMDVLTSGGSTVNWFRMVDGVVSDEVVVGSSESTIKTIEVVDLDGDGDRDVITIPTWGSVSVFINEGDEFSRRELPETGILAAGAVMDVDGDQVLDLVISDVASEAIKVYRQPQVVRLSPSTSVVSESSAAPFVLRVFVDAPATESIDVPFLVTGTGTYGVDYRLDGAEVVDGSHGVAVIAAGQSYVDLRLIPIADELAELVETAFVSLVSEPNVSAGLYLLDDQLGGDYGDAPAPYPVDPVSGGAAHFAVGPYLGENRTAEVAGVNSIDADDDAGDDGVTLTNVIPGNASSVASIDLSNAPGGAFLDGWIDFDGDGSWGGHGEKVFDSVPIVEGVSSLTFTTPGWAKPGLTFARFRVSTTGGLGLKGGALDGEVEDFRIVVQTPATVPVGFTHSVIGSEGIQTLFPKAVDFDRDGDVDVIYATVDRQIVWLESIGARQFQERPISVADATIWDLEVADINGDGALDVLVGTATLQSSTLMVLERGFEGDFSSRSIAEEFQDIGSIEVADIDGDGDSDLLVTGTPMRYGATDPQAVETVMWMENDGTGGLRYHKIDSLRVRPSDAAIADLDQDGILDFVVYGLYGDVVAWYRNDGKQQFVQQQVATSFSGPANAARYGSVTAADIDLDGDPDLLVSPGELGTPFAWYENNGEGAFIEKLVGHGLQGRTVEAVDVDGDGDLDAVYGGPGAFVWGENRVVGDYSGDHVVDQEDYIVWRSTYGQTGVNLGADGNRDGVIDAADYTIWRDAVSDAKPERTFVLHAVYPASIGGAAAADFDGDGDIDVIAGGGSGLVLFLNSAVVTVTSSGHIIDEAASGYVEVTVTRDRDWSAALEVGVDIKGVALSGVDYVLSGPISQSPGEAIVTIPAGQPSATFRVTAVDDALREFDEGLAITVQSGSNYVVQGPAEVRGVVVSDEVGGDFGDAPAPYRTLLADNGAFHTQGTAEDPRLGDSRGLQADASPSLDAGGDSSDDGVLSWELRVGETTASLTVDVQGSSGVLDVWIDLNQDGTWNGTWERVIASAPVTVGEHKLSFEIPSSALDGITYARLRISDAGVDGPDGFGGNGETEDYQVIVLPPVASSGHFSSRQPADVTGGGSAKHIAADLDRDGDTDFVILDSSNDRIVLAENTPNGFQATTLRSSYWNLVSLTVADIDGDGYGDIIAGFTDSQTVMWLRNNRDLSFGYRTHRVDGEPGHFGIVAGDLDGDGRQDLLSISGDYSSLVWHRNLPGGTFESTVVAVHPSGGLFLPSLVDIDGDGDLDVIIAHNVDDSGVSWYENNGSGAFTRRAVPAASHRPNSLQPIDFDRDGDQDLIAGLYQQGRVAWYENDGSEGFVERTLELAGASGYDVDAADFDGDGNLDLLASLNDGTAFNAVFLNNGAQEFSRQLLVSPTIDNHNSATDVDADGDLDVVSTRYNGQVIWFENQSIVDPVEQSPETDPAPIAAVNAPLTLADNGGLAESHLPLLSPADHDAFGDDILLRGSFDAQPRLETAAVDKAFSYQSLASGALPLVSDLGAEAETLEDSCADLCVEWDEFSDGDSVWTAQTREGGHWLRRRR